MSCDLNVALPVASGMSEPVIKDAGSFLFVRKLFFVVFGARNSRESRNTTANYQPAIIDSPVVPGFPRLNWHSHRVRAHEIESRSGNCFDCEIITLTLIYRHFGFEPPRRIIA